MYQQKCCNFFIQVIKAGLKQVFLLKQISLRTAIVLWRQYREPPAGKQVMPQDEAYTWFNETK